MLFSELIAVYCENRRMKRIITLCSNCRDVLMSGPFLYTVTNVVRRNSCRKLYVHFLLVCLFSFERLWIWDISHRLSQNLGLGRVVACRWITVEVLPSVSHPALLSLWISSYIDEMGAGWEMLLVGLVNGTAVPTAAVGTAVACVKTHWVGV